MKGLDDIVVVASNHSSFVILARLFVSRTLLCARTVPKLEECHKIPNRKQETGNRKVKVLKTNTNSFSHYSDISHHDVRQENTKEQSSTLINDK